MSSSRIDDLTRTALRLLDDDERSYPIVVKEILQVDVLHAMTAAGLFKHVAFKGGTALRLCYHSVRYSEDLDFSTLRPLTDATVRRFEDLLRRTIRDRYDLPVEFDDGGAPAAERDGR